MIQIRTKNGARASSAELGDARSSLPSFAPGPAPNNSVMPSASSLPTASLHLHSTLLSGVAGYVDAAGFASLIGLFPAHLTGELVGDAIAFSSGHPRDHRTHLWMLPVFVCSVMLATFVSRTLRRAGLRPLAGLLALVTVALALFSASDCLARALHQSARLTMLASGGCAVAAMGFQNALMRESLKASCPTTVMTGNLTQVVIDLTDRALNNILRPSPYERRPRSRLGPVFSALAAFFGCAVLGGWLTRTCGSVSAVLPTAVIAIMTVRAFRESLGKGLQLKSLARVESARLPTFEGAPVGRQPLFPESSELSSGTQSKRAPSSPSVPSPADATTLRPADRRTSGTRLAQRFRGDD